MADGYLNFDTKINTNGFNDGIKKLGNLAKTGTKVVGGALIGAIAASVKVGASFEAEMSKVSAISGAVGKDFEALSDKAKEMGAKTKFSASESAQALEYMAMAGWKTEDMLNGIEGIMNLAAASGEDLATTSDIVTDALTAFGMTAGDATHFADVLAQASSNANTNVGMMGETFKYVAPVAGALGFKAEDTAIAIGLMANSGIKASQAGTALRSIMSRMAKPTDEVQAAMDALGISLTDGQGNMKSLNEIMHDLRDGFSGLSEAERANMAASLGGQEAMSGLLAIVNASEDDFDKLQDSIYNCDGAAAKMAETAQDNLIGQLSILRSAAEGLGIEIYESLQKPLTNFVKKAVEVVSDLNKAYADGGFTGFLDRIGEKVPLVRGITDAIGDLAVKVQGMSTNELTDFAKKVAVIAGAGPVFSTLGSAASILNSDFNKFGQSFSHVISGIGKAPGALKGAAKGFQSNIGDIAKSFGNLKDTILLPLEGLKPKLSTFMSEMGDMWKNAPGGRITSAVSKFSSNIAETFGKIGPTLQKKFPKITSALSGLTSYVGAWGGLVGESFNGVLKTVGNFAPGFIKLLQFGVIAGALVAGLGLLQGQFGEQITSLLQMVAEKGPAIITGLCSSITGKLPELIALGGDLLVNLINAITANIPAVISGGISIIAGLVTGIASQLPALVPVALQMILTIITSLIQNIPQLINAGLQLLAGLAQGIINAVPVLINAIPGIIQGLVSGIAQNLPVIIATGIQILAMLIAGIIQAIPQLLAAIPDIFKAFADGIMSVDWAGLGKGILDAVVDGIKSIGGSLVNSVKSIFTGGEQAAEESGANTGNKYAAGMDSANETVAASAMNLGTSAADGIGRAGTTEAFTADAQNAVNGFSTTLINNGSVAGMAGNILGTAANNGVAGSGMYNAFNQSGVTAGQGLSEGISGQAGAVAGAASSVAGTAQASISSVNLGGTYSTAGSQAMQGLASSISSGNASVSTAAAGITKAAAAGLTGGKLPEAAKAEGKNMVTGLSGAIKAGNGTVRTSVSSLMTAAKTAANGLGTAGHTAGVQFSTGLANGILAGQHGVAQAAAQVANAAAQAAKSNLDIHSPSRVGMWIGKMFDMGIVGGIVRNTDKIVSVVGKMTDSIEEGTMMALNSLKQKAASGITTAGSRIYAPASGKDTMPRENLNGLLDEWERRQKKINQERDARPVLIDGRRVDRSMGKKGVVMV